MVPEINRRHLKHIQFPLYVLPGEGLEYRDGLVLWQDLVIDDKNMPGETLGVRRLQTPHKLMRLKKVVFTVAEMLASNSLLFIDYKGRTFRYKKTMFGSIEYKKIRCIEIKERYSLLYALGVVLPFVIQRPPQAGESWVGILYVFNRPWVIYELSETKNPSSRKKI